MDATAINELHWASFERRLASKRRSEATIKSYRVSFLDLLTVYSGDLADLTQTDVERWQIDALSRLAPATVAIRFRSLRALINFLVDEEIIEGRSPMARLSEPKGDDVPPPILTDDQLRALLKACDGKTFEDRRDTAIIRLFCEPGSPRVAEMASIATCDLNMGRNATVTVTGKGYKTRVIPIGAKAGMALDRYLRLRAKHRLAAHPALWLGHKGGPLTASGVAQLVRRRAEQAGIGHVHPHQFRHTSAHAAKSAGLSDEELMALFGWSSAEMPRRYGRSAGVERAHAAARRVSLGDRL